MILLKPFFHFSPAPSVKFPPHLMVIQKQKPSMAKSNKAARTRRVTTLPIRRNLNEAVKPHPPPLLAPTRSPLLRVAESNRPLQLYTPVPRRRLCPAWPPHPPPSPFVQSIVHPSSYPPTTCFLQASFHCLLSVN